MHLLLQLAAAADTVLVRNVPPVRTAFEQLVFVTSGLTSILLFLLICVLVVALLVLRTKANEVERRLDTLIAELSPMARNATEMSAAVRDVATNVNEMVAESRDTVQQVNSRVRATAGRLADEIDHLSEMVGRVNASAERVADVASTTIAGLKVGASALGLGKPSKARKAREAREGREAPRTAAADERPRLRRRD